MGKIFTIGSTQSTAERFFERLLQAEVWMVVDVRLRRESHLLAFAKWPDIAYFLEAHDISYRWDEQFATPAPILDAYNKKKIDWPEYERLFGRWLAAFTPYPECEQGQYKGAALLCSEASADKCHRRLVAEFLAKRFGWGKDAVVHL